MQTTTINARQIPPITLDRVAEVATAELEASIALLADLDDRDWARPTDCAGWTVHDLTAHLVGQYQGLAKLSVFLRRHRRAHRRYPALSRLDADNRQQIDDLGGRWRWAPTTAWSSPRSSPTLAGPGRGHPCCWS